MDTSARKQTKVVEAASIRRLKSKTSSIDVSQGPTVEGQWAGKRLLTLDGKAAFEMSFWCGTCPLVFQRLEGAGRTLSIEALTAQLNTGLDGCERKVVKALAGVVPPGNYQPLLLELHPKLIYPGDQSDYFTKEQVDTWGIDPFWGIPENPRTPYYRTPTRQVANDELLFEFVVPMVPPTWNDSERVEAQTEALLKDSRPTCVAFSTLDVRQQADWDTPEGGQVHWGLTHYLLDGHHKIEAAARNGLGIRLLALVSQDHSLAKPEDLSRVSQLLQTSPVRSSPK